MQIASIRSPQGIYGLLTLDQLPQLAELQQLNIDDSQDRQVLDLISQHLMKILSPEASGVIVSPEHTFQTIVHKSHSTGLLMSLEQRKDSIDPLSIPRLVENWGPEHVKNNYSLCKLELFYHPQEENAVKKKQLVAEIFDYCKYLGIDFLLDLRCYDLGKEAEAVNEQEATVWAIEEFRTLCNVLALDLPEDALAAVTLTAELDIPWILSSSDVKYEGFKDKLRLALESGAQGFMIGQALWAELPEPTTDEQGEHNFENTIEFIRTTARDRIIELRRITQEAKTVTQSE